MFTLAPPSVLNGTSVNISVYLTAKYVSLTFGARVVATDAQSFCIALDIFVVEFDS